MNPIPFIHRLRSFRSIFHHRLIQLLFLSILVSSFPGVSYGQDLTRDNFTGNWNDNLSWIDGSSPGFSVNNKDLENYGFISLRGNFNLKDGTIHIHDTLIVYGNFTLLQGSDLTVDNGGIVIIFGDFLSDNKVQINPGGYLLVTGNFEMQGADNQASIKNDGNVFIFDDTPQIITPSGYGDKSEIINDPINDFYNNLCCCETDHTDPALTLPEISAVQCSSNVPAPYANYDALVAAGGSASDNCGINICSFAHVSDVSNGATCPEVITRTYRICDNCGHSTTSAQYITINDNIKPTLTLPSIDAVHCSGNVPAPYANFAALVDAGGSASDNCGVNISSFSLANETSTLTENTLIITRTYQIADYCGNTATKEQEISVEDDDPPVISCPSDVIQCASDTNGAVIGGIALSAYTDNCTSTNDLIIEYLISGATTTSGLNDASGTLFHAGISIVEYNVTDENGNTSSCNFDVVVNPVPLTSDITGDINPACEAEGVDYSVNPSPDSKYYWTVPAGASITSDTTGTGKSSITVNFGTHSGEITVKETNSAGCTGETKLLSIDLQLCIPHADFDADKFDVCLGDTVTFWSTSTEVSEYASYSWDFGSDALPATATGPGPVKVLFTVFGTKLVTLTVNDGIINAITKDIIVHNLPAISLTGNDRCGEGDALFVASPTNANSVDFSLDGGLSVVSSDNSSPYEYSHALNESQSVTVWARADNMLAGCTSEWSDGVEVKALPIPVTGEIKADSPAKPGGPGAYLDIACGGESRLYSVDAVAGSAYRWQVPSLGIDQTGTGTIEIFWDKPQGEYEISLQEISEAGCEGSIRAESVFVSNPDINLGPDQAICQGDSISFEPGGNFSLYTWQDYSHRPTYTGYDNEEIWVRVEDEHGCEASDTVNLVVHPTPDLDLGNDTALCDDAGYELAAEGFSTYYWSTGENSSSIIVYPGAGEIILFVTDSNSCSTSDTIYIDKCDGEDHLFDNITNAFTPNNDGVHDVWVIHHIELYPYASIDVFDRNGRLVFHSVGYANDWDGTSGGKALPMDTYYYVIDFKSDQMHPIEGTVTIVR
jgi:gliding motility-associated-like protein